MYKISLFILFIHNFKWLFDFIISNEKDENKFLSFKCPNDKKKNGENKNHITMWLKVIGLRDCKMITLYEWNGFQRLLCRKKR